MIPVVIYKKDWQKKKSNNFYMIKWTRIRLNHELALKVTKKKILIKYKVKTKKKTQNSDVS